LQHGTTSLRSRGWRRKRREESSDPDLEGGRGLTRRNPLQHGTTSLRSRGWRRKRREESSDPDLEGGRGLRSRSPVVTYLAGTRRHRLVSGVMEDAKAKGWREREQEQR
jgi:hypothetical protein